MSLHMVRLTCDLPGLYRRIAKEHKEVDLGYAIHTHLREVFGDLAPQPFVVLSDSGTDAEVLGYGAHEKQALEDGALTLGWRELATKKMPELESRRELKFEVRVCPTRRGRFPRPGEGNGEPKPRELDAFLAAVSQNPGETFDRTEIYRTWLGERLSRGGAAELLSAKIERYQRARLFRRRQGGDRNSALLERPDVTFAGRLRVGDPAEFHRLLATGVGRHRAFGFGMLLLKAG